MKFNIISAALLLLTVINLSSGRTIQKRSPYGKETDLLDSVKKGRDTASIAADGYLGAIKFFRERADVGAAGEGAAGEGAAGEGAAGEGASGEGAQGGGAKGEGAQGEGAQGAGAKGEGAGEPGPSNAAPPPPTKVVAPKPAGLNPADEAYWNDLEAVAPAMMWDNGEFILWTGLTKDLEQAQIYTLKDALVKIPETSSVELTSSFDASQWGKAFKTYSATVPEPPVWKVNSILSIRFGEYIANQANPVHVLYGSAALDSAPENSLLGLGELPLITGPGSKVPVVYRWNLDTLDQQVGDGSHPTYTPIWKAGDPPLGGPGLTDLTNPPTVIETTNLGEPEAATLSPAGTPAGNDGSSDSGSNSGCKVCGVGCVCS